MQTAIMACLLLLAGLNLESESRHSLVDISYTLDNIHTARRRGRRVTPTTSIVTRTTPVAQSLQGWFQISRNASSNMNIYVSVHEKPYIFV